MRREATAVELRQNFGEFLNQVQYRGDSVVVTKDGKPVAALVDYALYERIRKLRESFMALTGKLGQVYSDVPAETAEAEINSATLQLPQAHDRLASVLASRGKAKKAPKAGNDF